MPQMYILAAFYQSFTLCKHHAKTFIYYVKWWGIGQKMSSQTVETETPTPKKSLVKLNRTKIIQNALKTLAKCGFFNIILIKKLQFASNLT